MFTTIDSYKDQYFTGQSMKVTHHFCSNSALLTRRLVQKKSIVGHTSRADNS